MRKSRTVSIIFGSSLKIRFFHGSPAIFDQKQGSRLRSFEGPGRVLRVGSGPKRRPALRWAGNGAASGSRRSRADVWSYQPPDESIKSLYMIYMVCITIMTTVTLEQIMLFCRWVCCFYVSHVRPSILDRTYVYISVDFLVCLSVGWSVALWLSVRISVHQPAHHPLFIPVALGSLGFFWTALDGSFTRCFSGIADPPLSTESTYLIWVFFFPWWMLQKCSIGCVMKGTSSQASMTRSCSRPSITLHIRGAFEQIADFVQKMLNGVIDNEWWRRTGAALNDWLEVVLFIVATRLDFASEESWDKDTVSRSSNIPEKLQATLTVLYPLNLKSW